MSDKPAPVASTSFTLGSIAVETTASRREQFTALIWGLPTAGKTVLASTAPGKKVWLQFDMAGTASLLRTDDLLVADFSTTDPRKMEQFKQGGVVEKDLLRMLKDIGPGNTVVVDSITSFGQLALYHGVLSGKASGKTFKATVEAPGMQGYGIRTALTLDFIAMVMRACGDTHNHCIFVGHQQESLDDDGKVNEITLSLGGSGRAVMPAKISEIWYLEDVGSRRVIYIRNHGVKRPMRSRMFDVADRSMFTLTYDQRTGKGDGIVQWYEAWAGNGFNRIPVPTP